MTSTITTVVGIPDGIPARVNLASRAAVVGHLAPRGPVHHLMILGLVLVDGTTLAPVNLARQVTAHHNTILGVKEDGLKARPVNLANLVPLVVDGGPPAAAVVVVVVVANRERVNQIKVVADGTVGEAPENPASLVVEEEEEFGAHLLLLQDGAAVVEDGMVGRAPENQVNPSLVKDIGSGFLLRLQSLHLNPSQQKNQLANQQGNP